METKKDLRLAVLIDADNIPAFYVKEMFEEIAKYGTPTFKRIYADWTKPQVTHWKNALLENGIKPVQQYSYTTGKNATDSAMIIDAMDVLYSGKVDGFCLVSSDSDFTPLATRLREAGMKVIGIGERKTPTPFITACEKFIYLEILKKPDKNEKPVASKAPKKKTAALAQVNLALIHLITDSINDVADESGRAFLGELGNLILKKQPDFDPRNYGFTKLSSLIRSIDKFEVVERNKQVYARTRKR